MEVHKSERVALSRDLSEFLVELSIALHRHSMYPTGHPALGPAVDAVARRGDRLLRDRASIAFGVARRQLIIEGITTDPNQPVLRRLAEGLHQHHIGAISIARGVQPAEFGEALRVLATEAERDGPLGLRPGGQTTSWPHIKLHPLTFDGLALVGDAPLSDDGESRHETRGVELWVGLARAALSSDASAPVATEPSVVARAIDEHPRAEAYDQVIVGYLLQIAHELKHASDGKAEELLSGTPIVLAVFGLAMIGRVRRSRVLRALTAVLACGGFTVLLIWTSYLAFRAIVPPLVAAWLPNIVFIGLAGAANVPSLRPVSHGAR